MIRIMINVSKSIFRMQIRLDFFIFIFSSALRHFLDLIFSVCHCLQVRCDNKVEFFLNFCFFANVKNLFFCWVLMKRQNQNFENFVAFFFVASWTCLIVCKLFCLISTLIGAFAFVFSSPSFIFAPVSRLLVCFLFLLPFLFCAL